MTAPTQPCPNCGAAATGNFCASCGHALGPVTCGRCQAQLTAGAKFCHRCGTAVGARPRAGGASERTAWIVAGVLALVLVGAVAYKVLAGVRMPARPDTSLGTTDAAAPFAGSSLGPAPDISKMTPEERFVRLNDRIMRAGDQGDTSTVINFTPMALEAYAQLPTPSVDDRYHAAILRAQVGDFVGALALADTIAKAAPGDLFAPIIRGTVAEFQGDATLRDAAFKDFLAHYPAESRKARPEYTDHKPLLDAFKQAADSGLAGKR